MENHEIKQDKSKSLVSIGLLPGHKSFHLCITGKYSHSEVLEDELAAAVEKPRQAGRLLELKAGWFSAR